MNESFGIDPTRNARLCEIAQELATHGLGILLPHKHIESGELVPLPTGEIALERALRVSFIAGAETYSAIPVGWRWNGQQLEVCAGCCGPGEPPP